MSWLDPGVVFDVGFQLSAASVLFITEFSRQMAHILGRLGLPSALAEPLALALVAQWATLPITIPVFGEMSLIAPLANIAVGPVMSALLVTGLGRCPSRYRSSARCPSSPRSPTSRSAR